MEVFVFDWWWACHQSSAHKCPRIFRFCIVSWKDEREPSIKHSMGRKIGVVQKFTGIQKLGQNWRWANWIRVEYFPRIHHIAAQPQSSRVIVEIGWSTREFLQDELSSCRCSTTSHGDVRTTRMNARQMLISSLSMRRNSEQDDGHSSDLDGRKSGSLLVQTVHKENGTKPLSWWCLNWQKADIQSSEPRVQCPEVSSKAKAVEN